MFIVSLPRKFYPLFSSLLSKKIAEFILVNKLWVNIDMYSNSESSYGASGNNLSNIFNFVMFSFCFYKWYKTTNLTIQNIVFVDSSKSTGNIKRTPQIFQSEKKKI